MLYDLGYKNGLVPGSLITSDPFSIIGENLVSIEVNTGTIFVNGDDRGSSTNALPGDKITITARSSGSFGVPRFIQFFQDNKLEGTLALINEFEETFEYNDALNGKYAWETLPQSTWTAKDNGSVLVVNEETNLEPLVDKELDPFDSTISRNRLHILDRYLSFINVLNFEGQQVGRIRPQYQGPVDSCTIYSSASSSKMFNAFAFLDSNKVVFYTDSYDEINSIDIDSPISITAVRNILFVAQKHTNNITQIELAVDGTVLSTTVIPMDTKPHRLYTLDERCGVLSETDLTFVKDGQKESVLSLPAFASSLYFDIENYVVYVSHRQERKVTKAKIDWELGHETLSSMFYAEQGYLDSIAYDRQTNEIYVSDIVNKEILVLNTSLGVHRRIPLEQHCYEMYSDPSSSTVIASALYPDIDERLIKSDGDPDYIDYENVIDIPVGATKTSPSYVLEGIREAVTLYLYPDDEDVSVRIKTEDQSYQYGKTIKPGEPFNFEVSLPGGEARQVNFVLGQTAYSFYASPDIKRLIPYDVTWEPLESVEPDTGYMSNVINVQGLDVETCSVSVTPNAVIYKNEENVGQATTVTSGDTIYLATISDEKYCDTDVHTVTWANIFESSWSVTTHSENQDPIPQFDSDFIDVYYAKLGQEYLSEPIIVNLQQQAKASINQNYGASIVVNGEDRGTSTTLENNDSVSLKLTTDTVYGVDHQLTLALCEKSVTWIVTTLPAVNIVPLEFGTHSGLTLGDRVQSDVVTLDIVSDRFTMDIVFPRNTLPIINGIVPSINQDALNYRNVLRRDYRISVVGGSQIQLEGYALGPYGSTTNHKIASGYNRGFWTLQSIQVDAAIKSRETTIEVEKPSALSQPPGVYTINQGSFFTNNRSFFSENVNTPQVVTGVSALISCSDPIVLEEPSYYVSKKQGSYSKTNRPEVSISSRDAIKSSIHSVDTYQASFVTRSVDDINTFSSVPRVDKAGAGLEVIPQHRQAEKENFGIGYFSQGIEYQKQYISSVSISGNTFDTDPRTVLEVERQFDFWSRDNIATGREFKYARTHYDIGKWFVQDFDKEEYQAPRSFVEEFIKQEDSSRKSFDQLFTRQTFINLAQIDRQWSKTTHVFYQTPLWLGVVGELSNSVKSYLNTVKINKSSTSKPSLITDYTVGIEYLTSLKSTEKHGVSSSVLAHSEVSVYSPNFVSIDTFSYTQVGSPAVVIDKDDCMQLGNEVCLDNGYFASEQQAIDNATQVWNVDQSVVRATEISPGCWIWSQRLPCVNPCYECPPTGYIQGG